MQSGKSRMSLNGLRKAESSQEETVKHGETLIVGLGEVGSALAEVLERKSPVLRHDIEPREFDAPIGVMHICIPFQESAQFEKIVCSYIKRFDPALTIINSTILPGTTTAIAARTGKPVAYSPVRGKHVRMTQDMLRYVKYVAASDPQAAGLAQSHFEAAGMKTRRMERPETLELAKLAETTYFGVLIAFAQDLDRYARRIGADYDEAINFFEEVDFLPRTRYFPGVIGGHCVLPNIQILRKIADSPLLEAVLESNSIRARELEPERAENRRRKSARRDTHKRDGDMLSNR
jgi:UDP-N-acetyl-D-mannosaminuronate dehydrogenase